MRHVRDLSSAGFRIVLELEVRRVACRRCGTVKRERLDFLADNAHFTKRFAFYVGRRCRQASIRDVAKELKLDWDTVKALEKQYMQAQLKRAGAPGPRAIGIDEISIRKGHSYRIVVSDLDRKRPIWFGGMDRSEASMALFYDWLGPHKGRKIKLAVMDMWKPFRNVTKDKAPQAAILFDKFHIMRHLGEALDKVRKAEYARVNGKSRRFIKGQKYNLLSRHENLTLEGKRSLKILLAANKRLNTAYVLKEAFGQLWDYGRATNTTGIRPAASLAGKTEGVPAARMMSGWVRASWTAQYGLGSGRQAQRGLLWLGPNHPRGDLGHEVGPGYRAAGTPMGRCRDAYGDRRCEISEISEISRLCRLWRPEPSPH
jgi:transposase